MSLPIEIKAGGTGPYDPAVGATICNIPFLKGKVIWIEKGGVGPFQASLYSLVINGGFQLTATTFQTGDYFRVHYESALVGASTSDYTNGYNRGRVVDSLLGRLAWRSSLEDGEPVLNSINSTSASGRWYNEAHALCTILNVKTVLGNPSLTDDQFNDELISIQIGVIMRMLNAVFCKKEFLEKALIYDREGYVQNPIENSNAFAGYEINVAPAFDKAIHIESAVLMFDQDVTFNLYLFKDGKKTPVWFQAVTCVANEATIVNFDQLILTYSNPVTKGQKFFLGYFQADLGTARAINEHTYCWTKTFNFSARPFYSAKKAGVAEFDLVNRYYPYNAMGINLQVNVFSDWTNLIEQSAPLFDELNGLSMAAAIIDKIVYTTAQNGTQRILLNGLTMPAAMADLTGSAPVSDGPPPIMGLNKRIERETKRVHESFFPKPTAKMVSLC